MEPGQRRITRQIHNTTKTTCSKMSKNLNLFLKSLPFFTI